MASSNAAGLNTLIISGSLARDELVNGMAQIPQSDHPWMLPAMIEGLEIAIAERSKRLRGEAEAEARFQTLLTEIE